MYSSLPYPPPVICRIVPWLLLCFGQQLAAQGVAAPSIQICQGGQTICIEENAMELCVKVIVEDNYPEKIDSFHIYWDDGVPPTRVAGVNASFSESYRYDFGATFESCNYTPRKLISLFTFINGQSRPIISSFPLTTLAPPKARFENFPRVVCVDETFELFNATCPLEELISTYDFGDGTPPGANPFHTYTDTGTYTVTMSVLNDCGMDEISRELQVIDKPVAVAAPDSGLVAAAGPRPLVCLTDRATIRLDGSASLGLIKRLWTVTPRRGVQIDRPGALISHATFTEPGVYTFQLKGSNGNCNLQSADTFSVEVVRASNLSLSPQPDACIILDYCPTPWVPEATYSLNGEPLDSCTQLGPGRYTVEASTRNDICGNIILRDTFVVSPQAEGNIVQSDTVLCDRADPLVLSASPRGGRWLINGSPFDGIVDPALYPSGRYRVTYGNEPCLTTDQLWVEVVAASVSVPNDTFLCIGSDPVTFAASPVGGQFSGPFVSADGTFDPDKAGVGVHRIFYSYHHPDVPGCGDQGSFVVVVSELDVDFVAQSCGGDGESCFALLGELAYERVEWDFGDGASGNGRQACHSFAAGGTYLVSVTVSSGPCRTTLTREITVSANPGSPPLADFRLTYANDECSDVAVRLEDVSYGSDITRTWYLGDSVISTRSDPQPLVLPSLVRDTSYRISLMVRNGCSLSLKTDSVFVPATPTALFDTDRRAYCSGDTIRIVNQTVGDELSYEWLQNGKVIGTEREPPVILHESESRDTLMLCLRITGACGMDEHCVFVTVSPAIVQAFFRLDAGEVCAGDSLFLTNLATSGARLTYDFGDGNGSSEASPGHVYHSAGTYRITQTARGCGEASFGTEVTVLERPSAAFDAPSVACEGEEVSFTNLSGTQLAGQWDFGDGSPPGQSYSPLHIFPGPGTYTVCLTVSLPGGNGCTDSVCREIEVSPRPRAAFAVQDTLCAGQPIRLKSTAAGTDLQSTFKMGNGETLVGHEPEYTFNEPGPYRIQQLVTDYRGCQDSTDETIYVRPAPTAAFAVENDEVCAYNEVLFINESQGASGFSWSMGDGTTTGMRSPTCQYASPGQYTVKLSVSDAYCSDTAVHDIFVRPTPVARFQLSDTAVCAGSSIEFTGASVGQIATRHWKFGDGKDYFGTNPTHAYADPGTYTTRLMVSDGRGCTDSTSVAVQVWEPAEVVVRQTDPLTCHDGRDASLEVGVLRGQAPFTYQWSAGETSAYLHDLGSGAYRVRVTDGRGCQQTVEYTVEAPQPIVVQADISEVSCFGEDDGVVSLRLSGGNGPFRVKWKDGSSRNTRANLTSGVYPLTVVDAAGCSLDTAFTVREREPIHVEYAVDDVSCYGAADGVIALSAPVGGQAPYQINLIGAGGEQTARTVSRFDSLPADVYLLEVIDDNRCVVDYDIQILEPDPLVLDILHDTIALPLGGTVQLATRYNEDQPDIRWSPAYELSCTECAEPLASPLMSQTYIATITTAYGCSVRDTVRIDVEMARDIYLPNTFTPNGDGQNDRFRVRTHRPEAVERVASFEIRDRWGKLIYSASDFPPNDPEYGWDGNVGGEPANVGHYAYQVVVNYIDGFEKSISGTILIMR